jgi:hypothetical protein
MSWTGIEDPSQQPFLSAGTITGSLQATILGVLGSRLTLIGSLGRDQGGEIREVIDEMMVSH